MPSHHQMDQAYLQLVAPAWSLKLPVTVTDTLETSCSRMADRLCDYLHLKIHCAVTGTASSSVQGRPGIRDAVAICQARKMRTDWLGRHNNLNRYAPGRPAQNISVCGAVGVLWRRWVTFGEYLTGKEHRPPTSVGVRKLEWLPFRVVSKYPQYII